MSSKFRVKFTDDFSQYMIIDSAGDQSDWVFYLRQYKVYRLELANQELSGAIKLGDWLE